MGIEQRVECESGKLLARITVDGIKLWCEKHKREEFFTWGQIDALRRPLTVQITMSTHTTTIIPH